MLYKMYLMEHGFAAENKTTNKFRLCRCLGLFMDYINHTNYTLYKFHLAHFVQSRTQQFSE